MMRLIAALLSAGGLLAAACGGAAAQQDAAKNWPSKPIHAVVPLAPGTGGDVMARLMLNQLALQLGQSIVIENKGGAGGTLGVAQVAKSDPDGYTLLAHSSTHVISPAMYTSLPYDTAGDFAGVMPIGSVPSALVAAPSKGIRNLKDFVEKAKATPGGFTYASAGVGSTTHLTAERFRLSAGFPAIHVPFRGGGFQPEIIAGRVDFAYSPIATSLPNIKDGRLQAVAVSSPQRAAALPDVPTTLEAGYADSDYVIWVGLFFPAKTPRAIVDRLNLEMKKAWENPALRERFAGLDVTPMPMTAAEFDVLIKKEIAANAVLAKAAGLQPN
ncbi:MAG: tripartite tricarboxylate transporter substrate binding protein [Hyphomicrobiales bacterium]|nr:tripartite tricarboxylate transporter substrate binding protein [Alphaproteobacteria bacterium]